MGERVSLTTKINMSFSKSYDVNCDILAQVLFKIIAILQKVAAIELPCTTSKCRYKKKNYYYVSTDHAQAI